MPTCAICQRATARCSGCQEIYYCGRQHQKEAWPGHKADCMRTQKQKASKIRPPQGPDPSFTPKPDPGAKGNIHYVSGPSLFSLDDHYDDCKTVHSAYGRLIDAYRMRVEDEYTFRGDMDGTGFLYGGTVSNPIRHFREFVTKAQRRNRQLMSAGKPGALPGWWNSAVDKKAIEKMAQEDDWFNIKYAVEKSDIQEHYGNSLMPMKLRILGESICGSLYDS
ncbi:uncharacterized protein EI90DRAFT_3041784 [Cantharellus anzutake]|uniref:uncharacterized protein n=1 Tax=Cantharellus anzutake TaxID=1750568 RepID=UPI001903DAF7|nr:uncharacterized protein EI90DRAFT_3041784 [Cantharellus anzutake]KAF8338137.1 hypothetical protein EI90DRAFT_3041784 [Cantharellus anzutake]